MEPDQAQVLNATYHLFDLDHLGLNGQAFIVIRDGKPTLAYRRFTRDRWSPEIMPKHAGMTKDLDTASTPDKDRHTDIPAEGKPRTRHK